MSEHDSSQAAMGRTAFELKGILTRSPQVCPICRIVTHGLEQHVEWLFYERVNDGPTREAIRHAGGFCRYHARLIARQADALGSAIIFKDVLTNALRGIEKGNLDCRSSKGRPALSRLFDQTPPQADSRPPCPLCVTERELEEAAVDSLLEALDTSDFVAAFQGSAGLCLPHLRLAAGRCRNQDTWKTVLETEQATLKTLIEELAELARKHDHRFKDEPRGAEADSWRRALNLTSGWPDE